MSEEPALSKWTLVDPEKGLYARNIFDWDKRNGDNRFKGVLCCISEVPMVDGKGKPYPGPPKKSGGAGRGLTFIPDVSVSDLVNSFT